MTDELDKIATPRGEALSMTQLAPEQPIAAPGQGADWFGPQQPMRPTAPEEVAGRQFDFRPGYNLAITPRAFEAVSFPELRALADAYDPVRLIIERRKDQICRLPWSIRPKHTPGKRLKAAQLSPQMRGVIDDVEQFFKMPAPDLNWRTWLRMLLEDLLVLDAPALFCERDHAGNLIALSPVDGSTIRPIISDDGRTPRPFRWNGQPFNWLGQTVDTTNFEAIGFRISGGLTWPPSFSQTLHGMPATNLSTWELLYRPQNRRTFSVYGRSAVEQVMTTVAIAMRRANSQLEYFREGNQPDAVFSLPASWPPDKVQQFQDYWDSLFVGNLAARRRMKFVVSDTANAYQALKEPPLKSEFDEWLIRIVCFAFSYPPSAFVSLSNRSIAEAHERQAEEEGIEPLKAWFTELANEIIEREFSDEVEFTFIEENEIDQKAHAEILSTLVSKGILSANEAREKLGEEPNPNPAANELMVQTATGYVPLGGREPADAAAPNEGAN